jgi:hypothetical protein
VPSPDPTPSPTKVADLRVDVHGDPAEVPVGVRRLADHAARSLETDGIQALAQVEGVTNVGDALAYPTALVRIDRPSSHGGEEVRDELPVVGEMGEQADPFGVDDVHKFDHGVVAELDGAAREAHGPHAAPVS